jgi:hypothetical protein
MHERQLIGKRTPSSVGPCLETPCSKSQKQSQFALVYALGSSIWLLEISLMQMRTFRNMYVPVQPGVMEGQLGVGEIIVEAGSVLGKVLDANLGQRVASVFRYHDTYIDGCIVDLDGIILVESSSIEIKDGFPIGVVKKSVVVGEVIEGRFVAAVILAESPPTDLPAYGFRYQEGAVETDVPTVSPVMGVSKACPMSKSGSAM